MVVYETSIESSNPLSNPLQSWNTLKWHKVSNNIGEQGVIYNKKSVIMMINIKTIHNILLEKINLVDLTLSQRDLNKVINSWTHALTDVICGAQEKLWTWDII